jgi:hypothetical protein
MEEKMLNKAEVQTIVARMMEDEYSQKSNFVKQRRSSGNGSLNLKVKHPNIHANASRSQKSSEKSSEEEHTENHKLSVEMTKMKDTQEKNFMFLTNALDRLTAKLEMDDMKKRKDPPASVQSFFHNSKPKVEEKKNENLKEDIKFEAPKDN